MSWWRFKKYVPVAKRRANAAREATRLTKKGQNLAPVTLSGRTISVTFWGKSWCENLEAYSDYSNRLPRGRTYVRNGSVIDLQIETGRITAMVSGSELYRIKITIKPLATDAWKAVKAACSGQIGSLVELLQGRLSKGVMDIVTEPQSGLFPKPREISMSCSCPDGAGMCKHLAATLYGVGARLDDQPELLFKLRQVDHLELVAAATEPLKLDKTAGRRKKTIAASELADVFGIEMSEPAATAPPAESLPRKSRSSKRAELAGASHKTRGKPTASAASSTAKSKARKPAQRAKSK